MGQRSCVAATLRDAGDVSVPVSLCVCTSSPSLSVTASLSLSLARARVCTLSLSLARSLIYLDRVLHVQILFFYPVTGHIFTRIACVLWPGVDANTPGIDNRVRSLLRFMHGAGKAQRNQSMA
jgi:hypothetical protein